MNRYGRPVYKLNTFKLGIQVFVLAGCNNAAQPKFAAADMELARCAYRCMFLMRTANSNDDVLSIRQHLASK